MYTLRSSSTSIEARGLLFPNLTSPNVAVDQMPFHINILTPRSPYTLPNLLRYATVV